MRDRLLDEKLTESVIGAFYIGWQRLDIVVDHRLIVELKATEILPPNARRQLLSYLSATQLELGLLLHFGPKARFYRLINSNGPR